MTQRHPIPDPGALRDLARQLDALAARAQRVSEALAAQARGSEPWWIAPAADRYRRHLHDEAAKVGRIASGYREQARLLRAQADRAEADRRFFGRLERLARDALDQMTRAGLPIPTLPRVLPPSAHPDWADIARRLGVR